MSEYESLLETLSQKRQDMKEQYNRVLPTGELLFNRFDKAEYVNAGEGSSIYDTSIIMGDVKIGKGVWVGPYTLLEGIHGKLTVGDGTAIGPNTFIFTHDASKNALSGGKLPYQIGNVTIGRCCHISFGSIIGHNVTIGDHCLIGVHSYVNRDVPDNSIVFGVPAKVAGRVIVTDDDVLFEFDRK